MEIALSHISKTLLIDVALFNKRFYSLMLDFKFFLTLTLFLAGGMPQAQGSGANFSESDIESAFSMIAQDMLPEVKKLSREIYLFHWSKTRYIGSKLKLSRSKFFEKEQTHDYVGPGFYAAIDPYRTRSFGDRLGVISAPRGVRFYDSRKYFKEREKRWDGIAISKQTASFIHTRGLDKHLGLGSTDRVYYVRKKVLIQNFSRYFARIMGKLGV